MDPSNVRILVVEDDKQIRSFIAYALNAEGFRHIAVGTGQGALSALVTDPVGPDAAGIWGFRT